MAIKPEQIPNLHYSKMTADELEQSIDSRLENRTFRYYGRGSILIKVSLTSPLRPGIAEEIKQRYQAAGWTRVDVEMDSVKVDEYNDFFSYCIRLEHDDETQE